MNPGKVCLLHWLERQDGNHQVDESARGKNLAKDLPSHVSPSKQSSGTGGDLGFKKSHLFSLAFLKYVETAFFFFLTLCIFCNYFSFTFSLFNRFPLENSHCSLLGLQSENFRKDPNNFFGRTIFLLGIQLTKIHMCTKPLLQAHRPPHRSLNTPGTLPP